MTAPIYCRYCGAPIRFVRTRDGKKRPVERQGRHMTLDPNGPDLALCERTGNYERGRIGPVQPGKPWQIVYLAHVCRTAGA